MALFKGNGPLDFAMTGILATLALTLNDASISILAISTYDTDYLMVKEIDLKKATQALIKGGHAVT